MGPGARRVRVACPLDCFDTCAMIATVESGRIVKLEGDPDHPITRGFLCSKGQRLAERASSPQRVTTPLVRDEAGQWRQCTWDEALDLVAAQLADTRERLGSLGVYYNSDAGSMGMLKSLDERFWNMYGGATLPAGSLCSSAGIAALTAHYGRYTSPDPLDIPNSRFIILWGKNPAVTSIHMLPLLKEAKARGARVALIDPVRTESAAVAHQVIQPRPGSDGALALAMAGAIIRERLADEDYIAAHVHGYEEFSQRALTWTCERAASECDVPADVIRGLAMEYARTRPASIWVGFGLQRHAGGGGAVRAIDALTVITGNVGVSGGGTGYAHRNTRRNKPLEARERASAHRRLPRGALGKALLEADEPPIEVCFITRSNPMCQSPNTASLQKALSRMKLVVVADMFMTDTARAAHVFLPCAGPLEEDDVLMSYWHNFVSYSPAAVEPPGLARSDLEIWSALAQRLGFGEEFSRTPRQWIEYALKPMAKHGVMLGALAERGWMRDPKAPMVPWADGAFPTPTGKIELWSSSAQSWGADPLPGYIRPAEVVCGDYPLTLISAQPRHRLHSQFDEVNDYWDDTGLPPLRVHPDVATSRGIADGATVRLVSRRGSARFRCVYDEGLRRDTVACTNGRPVHRGGGVNYLTGSYISDIGMQAALYDCQCELEPDQ